MLLLLLVRLLLLLLLVCCRRRLQGIHHQHAVLQRKVQLSQAVGRHVGPRVEYRERVAVWAGCGWVGDEGQGEVAQTTAAIGGLRLGEAGMPGTHGWVQQG